MKYKALHSFCGIMGVVSRGQELTIKSKEVSEDLVKAGLIEPVETATPAKAAKATAKKAADKAVDGL